MSEDIIRVGLGVVALNSNGQILAGKRIGKHGAGTWGLVGGMLEFGESFEEGARREMLEETGLELKDAQVLCVANHLFKEENRHSVTVFVIGRVTGEPQLLEPEKCEAWCWFDTLSDVPQPHFVPYLRDINSKAVSDYIRDCWG